MPNIVCIKDTIFDLIDSSNIHLKVKEEDAHTNNSNQLTLTGNFIIGAGQIMMYFWIISALLIWIVKVKNLRCLSAHAVYYLFRFSVFLHTTLFQFPTNLVWKNPGFFTFTVPYDHTRDFYYSGHTGALVIIFLAFYHLKLKITYKLVGFCAIFMVNLLMITTVHYNVDIIGALIFSFWYYRQTTRGIVYIDKLISFPFYFVNLAYHRYFRHTQLKEKYLIMIFYQIFRQIRNNLITCGKNGKSKIM